MRVLVDTSALSRALRRRDPELDGVARALAHLIRNPGILIVGPVRQELLSGIREPERFGRIREKLRIHREINPTTEDFERAAAMSNTCGAVGIQGSSIDFLICAMAARLDAPIFTLDKDFERYAKHLPIRLHAA